MAKRGKRKLPKTKKKTKPSYKIIQERRLMIINYLLKHPCVDCGEKDIVVLQFDHVRGKKIENVSYMVRMGYDADVIMEEVSKCEVRCSNDHARKTAKEQGWVKARYLEI